MEPSYEENRDSFNPAVYATCLLKKHHFKTLKDTKEIFWYKDGIYQADGEVVIQEHLVKDLGKKAKPHHLKQVAFIIQGKTFCDRKEMETSKIATENCLLDPSTQSIEQFNPKIFVTTKLPLSFNPSAKCPKILKILTEIVGTNQLPIIQELSGYFLYKKMLFHKAIMLVGDGANGKTTLLDFLIRFLGEENCSAVTLQNLCEGQFGVAQLYGKLANIADDIPSTGIKNSGMWKMITGGARIMAQFKHKPIFNFWPTAKHIFSANRVPMSYEDSLAWWRRWIIIICENYFVEGVNAKEDILEEMTSTQELSGFLNWALVGLNRLLTNKKFSINTTIEEMRKLYLRKADSVRSFIQDHIVLENCSDCYLTLDDYYQKYRDYCNRWNLPVQQKKELTIKTKNIYPEAEKTRRTIDGQRVRVWNHLKFEETKVEEDQDHKLAKMDHLAKTSNNVNNNDSIFYKNKLEPVQEGQDVQFQKLSKAIDELTFSFEIKLRLKNFLGQLLPILRSSDSNEIDLDLFVELVNKNHLQPSDFELLFSGDLMACSMIQPIKCREGFVKIVWLGETTIDEFMS